jgi:acylphosphatase
VSGRVQGVWFRAHTERKARALGLVGWVRNAPDGTVHIVAEGPREALDALVEWAWKGSPHSEVAEVVAESQPASGSYSTFETRY